VFNLRIVSADSAAAILDEKLTPLELVASVAVRLNLPSEEAHIRLAQPLFRDVEDTYEAIVDEAQLCQVLLETVKANVVHLDSSLGGVPVDKLSPLELANLKVSNKARSNLLKILPKLRRTAGEIRRKHGIEMLAIGKESVACELPSGVGG
jgi:hypothetical protein